MYRSLETDPRVESTFPEGLRGVYSSSIFLSRLALHIGMRIGDGIDRWSPLLDWWARSNGATTPAIVAMRRHVLAQAPEIARDLETLRTWTPPAPPLPGTLFAEVYGPTSRVCRSAPF